MRGRGPLAEQERARMPACCAAQIFCGMLSRMRQYADIVAHAKALDASGKGPK